MIRVSVTMGNATHGNANAKQAIANAKFYFINALTRKKPIIKRPEEWLRWVT